MSETKTYYGEQNLPKTKSEPIIVSGKLVAGNLKGLTTKVLPGEEGTIELPPPTSEQLASMREGEVVLVKDRIQGIDGNLFRLHNDWLTKDKIAAILPKKDQPEEMPETIDEMIEKLEMESKAKKKLIALIKNLFERIRKLEEAK